MSAAMDDLRPELPRDFGEPLDSPEDTLGVKQREAEGLNRLIKACWAADPRERPSFGDILKSLTDIANRFDRVSAWEMRVWCFYAILYRAVLCCAGP